LGENTADNGGLRVAYMALMDRLAGQPAAKIDGFTPEQRLFLGYAQIWCQNSTEEGTRVRTLTDPHSPGRWRVNGVVVNMPEFQKAFSCPKGSPMVSDNACHVFQSASATCERLYPRGRRAPLGALARDEGHDILRRSDALSCKNATEPS
jgi:hypothetical protein